MNLRLINLLLVVACAVAMLLGIIVGLEDHEYWGILQFAGYAVVNAVLGAAALFGIYNVVKE